MPAFTPESDPYTGAMARAMDPGSLAATINLPAFSLRGTHLSMAFSWTGTPTGTLKLQHSFNGVDFFDTPGASAEFTAQPAGGAGSVACNWSAVPGTMVRFVYTRSSGTGTLTSYRASSPG